MCSGRQFQAKKVDREKLAESLKQKILGFVVIAGRIWQGVTGMRKSKGIMKYEERNEEEGRLEMALKDRFYQNSRSCN